MTSDSQPAPTAVERRVIPFDLLQISAVGFMIISFASYWDVFSHRVIFINNTDPVWNPAHIVLYAGFLLLTFGALQSWRAGARNIPLKLVMIGIAIVFIAAGYNEVWHRVLGYGITRPEPYKIEPPHALLTIGFVTTGAGAILLGMRRASKGLLRADDLVYLSLLSGSLWLIVAGAAFFVGGAMNSDLADSFAVFVGSFSSTLFVSYTAKLSRKFGYATLASVWFYFVFIYFLAFYKPPSFAFPLGIVFPLGIGIILLVDFITTRSSSLFAKDFVSRSLLAVFYGFVYFPLLGLQSIILPTTVQVGVLLGASLLGAGFEYMIERAYVWVSSKGIIIPSDVIPRKS